MWNTIATAIKTFLEKHFIPTLVAIVLMVLALLLTPVDFWIYDKLGKAFYCLLCFALSFLLVSLVVYVVKKIKDSSKKRRAEAYEKERNIRNLWSRIDRLSQREYDLIIMFLKNKNQPKGIVTDRYSYGSIYDSDLLIKSQIGIEEEPFLGQVYMYQIAPKKYELMLYSIHKYQKICNFKTLTSKDIEETKNDNNRKTI